MEIKKVFDKVKNFGKALVEQARAHKKITSLAGWLALVIGVFGGLSLFLLLFANNDAMNIIEETVHENMTFQVEYTEVEMEDFEIHGKAKMCIYDDEWNSLECAYYDEDYLVMLHYEIIESEDSIDIDNVYIDMSNGENAYSISIEEYPDIEIEIDIDDFIDDIVKLDPEDLWEYLDDLDLLEQTIE